MEIPFLIKPGAGQGHYPENLYYEPETATGRPALVGTPGLSLLAILQAGQPCRGAHEFDGYLYVVCGSAVYRVSPTWIVTACTGTLGTSTGAVYMQDNGLEMMIVDGLYGYLVTGTTVTRITDADFPTPSSLEFQDGYFIVTRADTGEIWISGLYNGSVWDALDYATAEGHPDKALRVPSNHRELWVFGSRTVEPFYNSGDADFPFERIQGAFVEAGLGAAASVTAADNSLWWVTDLGQIVRANGYTPVVVSTPEIERQMAAYPTLSDAAAWSYTHGGHTFVWFVFPSGDASWVYDAATSLWHKRTSYKSTSTAMGRHRAACYARFNGVHVVGDFENGRLYRLNHSVYADDGHVQRAVHVAPVMEQDRQVIGHARLELHMKVGVGLATGQGSEPQVMLDWSDDDGRTWSNERWASMGKIGEYDARVVYRRLGSARKRLYRMAITDPVERVIYGGHVETT